MPKKPNSSGEMQNYNPNTGEYESQETSKSFKSFNKGDSFDIVNEKRIGKNANKGYVGYSMSKRAEEAYKSGEKPLTKWKKEEIIQAYPEKYHKELSKLNEQELKDNFLYFSSWHHTSKAFNKTDFYRPYNEDEIDDKTIMEKINHLKTQKESFANSKIISERLLNHPEDEKRIKNMIKNKMSISLIENFIELWNTQQNLK